MRRRPPPLPAVRYGQAALSDVMPSVLAALGVSGEANPLQIADTRCAVVLLVDGLGWNGLTRRRDVAPYLAEMNGRSLTAGFPSTTVTSLASLGTGLPPGTHGLTGYSSYVDELDVVVNWLAWRPVGGGADLQVSLVPELVQPQPTVFERGAADGVQVSVVSAAHFEGSGLTRAVLRGGRYLGTVAPGDLLAEVVAAAEQGGRRLVYCYLSELDLVGHVRGPDSDAWLAQLSIIDRFVAELADRLPADATLIITADHGMVGVLDADKVDFDSDTALQSGVTVLAGEPRARHVHVQPGAVDDVLATWQELLGDQMWILTRDEAIAAGLFGPTVPAAARRMGDLIAVSHTAGALVRREFESRLSALTGQHGSLTEDELLVPLLTRELGSS
jgi:hypothetical protein